MSTRTTVRDVRARFAALVRTCNGLGMDASHWQLHEGSSTYGRAYRLYDNGRGVLGLSQGYLGITATEAYRTLEVILGTLWALQEDNVLKNDQKTAS